MAEGEDHRWEAHNPAGASGIPLAIRKVPRECLQALSERPDTIKGLMERLGWDRAKVHYALSVLKDKGFAG